MFLIIYNIIQRNDNSGFYKHTAPSWREPYGSTLLFYNYIIIIINIFFISIDTSYFITTHITDHIL